MRVIGQFTIYLRLILEIR